MLDRLSVRELRVLATLKTQPGLSLTELARTLSIPPSSMHGTLMKLQAMGFSERRNSNYYLTPNGEKALDDVKKLVVPLQGKS